MLFLIHWRILSKTWENNVFMKTIKILYIKEHGIKSLKSLKYKIQNIYKIQLKWYNKTYSTILGLQDKMLNNNLGTFRLTKYKHKNRVKKKLSRTTIIKTMEGECFITLLCCQSGRDSIYKIVDTKVKASIHIKQACDSIKRIDETGVEASIRIK